MPDPIAASHDERTAALLAALGRERLANLLLRFRADLAGLAAAARAGADRRLLHQWSHRLQGSAGTLGLDATAAALAAVSELIAADPAAVSHTAVMDGLDAAEAGRARAWQSLAMIITGLDGHHDPEASKR